MPTPMNINEIANKRDQMIRKIKANTHLKIASQVRCKQNDLFGSYDSIEELIKAQHVKDKDVVVLMIAINTTLKMIANDIENNTV